MTPDFLTQVDWERPWLAPYRTTAQPIITAPDWRAALNDAARRISLHNHRGMPMRFVPQSELPAGTAYEAFISTTGCVPTRDNLHDFFNALVWLTFPHIKVQLNALQAAELERQHKTPGGRGKLRDRATIFDENAALLVTRDADLVAALRAHRWQELFVTGRARFWQRCGVILFGHALMEKLVMPYKAITAHAALVRMSIPGDAVQVAAVIPEIDRNCAARLAGNADTLEFMHLPVLGVPGWWEQQGDAFYADDQVFRPPRRMMRT